MKRATLATIIFLCLGVVVGLAEPLQTPSVVLQALWFGLGWHFTEDDIGFIQDNLPDTPPQELTELLNKWQAGQAIEEEVRPALVAYAEEQGGHIAKAAFRLGERCSLFKPLFTRFVVCGFAEDLECVVRTLVQLAVASDFQEFLDFLLGLAPPSVTECLKEIQRAHEAMIELMPKFIAGEMSPEEEEQFAKAMSTLVDQADRIRTLYGQWFPKLGQ